MTKLSGSAHDLENDQRGGGGGRYEEGHIVDCILINSSICSMATS